MRFIFYVLLITQFLNFLGVFAEKIKKNSSTSNLIKWEKVDDNNEKPLKQINWESYKDNKSYFNNK